MLVGRRRRRWSLLLNICISWSASLRVPLSPSVSQCVPVCHSVPYLGNNAVMSDFSSALESNTIDPLSAQRRLSSLTGNVIEC